MLDDREPRSRSVTCPRSADRAATTAQRGGGTDTHDEDGSCVYSIGSRRVVTASQNCHMADTLFHKVWDAHTVRTLPSGQTQLFVGLHLVHEVTTPQAFDMLRQHGWTVAFPGAHVRDGRSHRADELAEAAVPRRDGRGDDGRARAQLPRRRHQPVGARTATTRASSTSSAPSSGLTQPGMTIACGDSHTSTHGALGAIAFGIGTSQVRDVLASQCLALDPLKVRRIDVNGRLRRGVYAKDVILTIIRRLGVHGGVGFAYEYGGTTLDRDDRSTSG